MKACCAESGFETSQRHRRAAAAIRTVALIGAPNTGKSTLFNALTGARQRVGNFPGITVERKIGRYDDAEGPVQVVDLPGTYSLSMVHGSGSADERVTRSFLLSGEADAVINVIDATRLEHGLYLTAQLLEMRVPLIVVLNMMDQVRAAGMTLDTEALSRELGCPVVAVAAARGEGIDALRAVVRHLEADLEAAPPQETRPRFDGLVEAALNALEAALAEPAETHKVPARWLAVKLLEGDEPARALAGGGAAAELEYWRTRLENETGEDGETLVADGRYAFAHAVAGRVIRVTGRLDRRRSDAIDRVVLNPWLGVPIFLGAMYLMFTFTIVVGGAFIDAFDLAAGALLVDGPHALLDALDAPPWVGVLLADGIGGGIQVVMTFVPVITALYLFLSFLEDSGYMARAAFLMDRYMRAIGLPGKAFASLVVGFGCNVPAVMATRTLEQQRDRIITAAMTPFMSCGARLAVYALFVAAFFPSGGQNVVFTLYLAGIAVAVLTALVLKSTLLRGESTPFVIELPVYRLPRLRDMVLHTWARLKSFVVDAGRIIVTVVVVLAFLNSVGTDGSFGNEDSDRSLLSAVSRTVQPVFEPLGITDDNWPAVVGVVTGVFAKEAVVGTLDALYGGLAEGPAEQTDDGFDLGVRLGEAFATVPENLSGLGAAVLDPLGLGNIPEVGDPASAAASLEVSETSFAVMANRFDGLAGVVSYLLFVLLYVPCVAVMGTLYREIGGRWTLFVIGWTGGMAYFVSVAVYQAATFARHPTSSALWIGGLVLAFGAVVTAMRLHGRSGHHPPSLSPAE